MQITKIAQSGRKGNQAGIVLGTPRNTNHQKNVIGKNISRSHNKFVKRSNRLEYVITYDIDTKHWYRETD